MIRPLRYNNKYYFQYGVDSDGNIYYKRGTSWHKMSVTFNVNDRKRYPAIKLRLDGKRTSVQVHRAICESLHEVPVMEKINDLYGEDRHLIHETPKEVLVKMVDYFLRTDHWQVNHEDHDKANFHPSNLEWVKGPRENIEKHKEFRKNNILLP